MISKQKMLFSVLLVLPWFTCPKAWSIEAEKEASQGELLQKSMIWTSSAPAGQNAYVGFRKTVDLAEAPEKAELRIFADTRYLLWINGTYLERGPCRFDPQRPEYDVLDVKEYFKKGTNVIAVLVHHFGQGVRDTSRFMEHEPGLAVSLEAVMPAGEGISITTDSSWRCSVRKGVQAGILAFSSVRDNIDARLENEDWKQTGFDDSSWEKPITVDGTKWGRMFARSIPRLRETERIPEIIVQETMPSEGDTSKTIRNDIPQYVSQRFPLSMKKGHQIILDIGKAVQAYSVLDLEAEEGSVIEVQYAMLFYDNDRKPTTHAGLNDAPNRYVARAGRQTYMATDTFGCKYVVIRLMEGAITLHSVKMVNRLYPYARAGRFVCSDPVLTGLWNIGANTIEVCSEDAYVDCIDRERAQWIADGYLMGFPVSCVALAGPGTKSNEYCFMDTRLLRNIIRHIGLSQLPDGRLFTLRPANRPPDEIHAILDDYSCLWVQAVREYYDLTGDLEQVREVWPTLVKALNYYLGKKTVNGLILAREFSYPGNPLAYKTCEGATFNAYLTCSLRDGAYLGNLIKESRQADIFGQAAKDLYTRFNEQLWDASSGSYCGSIMDGKKTEPTGHAAMFALYYDVVPAERKASVFQHMLDHWNDGFPYTHYFYLHVLYRQNGLDMDLRALNRIRTEWAGMLNYETGTTSESFGGGSMAHEAGAVPTYFLSRYVLGVRCEGIYPNRRIRIEPRLGDLHSAEGTVLTDFGPVNVSWRKKRGKFLFSFDVPEGTQADVAVPISNPASTLILNGQTQVKEGMAQKGFSMDSQYIRFSAVGGTYSGTITPIK